MTITYRTPERSELDAVITAGGLPFGETAQPEDRAYVAEYAEPDRIVVAEDGGRIIGVGAAMSQDVSVPGAAALPMCTVGLLSVLPTHRRRGIASAIIERLHRQAAERGEPVAGLMASEARIYGRFGYGIATRWALREIATAHAAMRDGAAPTGRLRFVEPDEASTILLDALAHLRRTVPGIPGNSAARVRGRFARDPEHWRDGAGARMLVACEDRGVVAYRIKQDWSVTGPAQTLVVSDLVARDDGALAALWAYCLNVDLVATVEAWGRPVDEPLAHLLHDPRRLRSTVTDALWLRVLDTPAALQSRRYDADGAWTLELVDPGGPAGGSCRLVVDGGEAAVEANDAPPDVTLPVDALGAALLGGTRLTGLARAGRASEHTPGALRALDRALAWDPLPWCPFEL